MKIRIILALFFSHVTLTCYAAENSPVKSNQDVTGCWELIVFSEEAKKMMNKIEPWPSKYQWFCFSEDGALKTMTSSSPTEVTATILNETLSALPKDISYEILRPGIMITKQPSVSQNLGWSVSFYTDTVLFDGKEIGTGTLVMGLINPNENEVIYYRYLRRVK